MSRSLQEISALNTLDVRQCRQPVKIASHALRNAVPSILVHQGISTQLDKTFFARDLEFVILLLCSILVTRSGRLAKTELMAWNRERMLGRDVEELHPSSFFLDFYILDWNCDTGRGKIKSKVWVCFDRGYSTSQPMGFCEVLKEYTFCRQCASGDVFFKSLRSPQSFWGPLASHPGACALMTGFFPYALFGTLPGKL